MREIRLATEATSVPSQHAASHESPDHPKLLWRFMRGLMRLAFPVWFRLRVRGLGNIPTHGAAILVIDHQSLLDCCGERPSTRALMESRPPVANTCRKAGRSVWVARTSPHNSPSSASRSRSESVRFLRAHRLRREEPNRAVGRQRGESRLPQERSQWKLNLGRSKEHGDLRRINRAIRTRGRR